MAKKKQIRIDRKTNLQITFLLFLLVAVLFLFSRNLAAGPPQTALPAPSYGPATEAGPLAAGGLELPAVGDTTFVLRNRDGRYTLLYDTSCRQAAWVAYVLTRDEVRTRGVGRQDRFRPDPQVIARGWCSAVTSDYTRSGYDRGHLLPSADRNATAVENRATFLLSNVSPQYPALNRGAWKKLEEQVRAWAERYDTLYIVTGGILSPGLPRIKGGVGVPSRFFKALLARCNGRYVTAAFLLPNSAEVSGAPADYVLTVDELEEMTGYDFFCRLPDSIEAEAECEIGSAFRP